MKNTIHIDMDGVVADWDRAATEWLKTEHPVDSAGVQEERWPPHLWEQLRTIPHFYRNLPKMARADDMITLARKFRDELGWNLVMLTAIPRGNDVFECFDDKFHWMQERYPDIPVHFGPYSQDKQDHVKKPGDILVDDRRDNCEQWEYKGGVAVRVLKRDYDQALEDLEEIFEALKLV
jgi:5'(3')-deoxyribonucleotidase